MYQGILWKLLCSARRMYGFRGWQISEFEGGKWPIYGGGKCLIFTCAYFPLPVVPNLLSSYLEKKKSATAYILNVTHHWKCHRPGLTWKLPIRVKSSMLHMENLLDTPISPAVINMAFSLHIKWAFLDLWYLVITKIQYHHNKNDQFLSILIL